MFGDGFKIFGVQIFGPRNWTWLPSATNDGVTDNVVRNALFRSLLDLPIEAKLAAAAFVIYKLGWRPLK